MPVSKLRGRQPLQRRTRRGPWKCSLRLTGTEPMADGKPSLVASAVPSGFFLVSARKHNALRTAHTTARRMDGFTLAELLVSVAVLVVLILLFAQLLKSAATITTLGHGQMDADSQARQLLDRMAIDFAQ